jgi:hypothetical protein
MWFCLVGSVPRQTAAPHSLLSRGLLRLAVPLHSPDALLPARRTPGALSLPFAKLIFRRRGERVIEHRMV